MANTNTALIQVLGAIAYGEKKAYEEAKNASQQVADENERITLKKIAAEELRHHKGFVRRLNALGADPERAMRPYIEPLDKYHGMPPGDEISEAVWSFLGEGVATDMLIWLKKVVDPETSSFVDTVMEDEAGHERHAVENLKAIIGNSPANKLKASKAAFDFVGRMLFSSGGNGIPFYAFVRLGRPHELLTNLITGYLRRIAAIQGIIKL
jgi:rubrerythrin